MGELLTRRPMLLGECSSVVDDKTLFDQYIRPGFWIDGIQNTANGHDSSATHWLDHASVDPQKEFAYNSGSVVANNYCSPNGQMDYYEIGTNTSKNIPQIADNYSIEVVIEISPAGVSQMISANRGNAYGTVWINSSGTALFFSAGYGTSAVGILAEPGIHTYVATGKGKTYYKDGMPVREEDMFLTSGTWGSTYRSYLFYYNVYNPRPCVSNIYAMRWYDRGLTAEEVRHNYELDKIRFNSGV